MHRRDIYITQVLHLLPEHTVNEDSRPDLEECSFCEVTQHELIGRRVIALGRPAKKRCDWLKKNAAEFCYVDWLPHPSARGSKWQQRANELAEALCRATGRKYAKRRSDEPAAGLWQIEGRRRIWPKRDRES